MNILLIGGGGREHAMAWTLSREPQVQKVYVAPGNGGTAGELKVENVAIDVLDFDALIALARDKAIALTLVGPEAPLCEGIVDAFTQAGLAIFGPTKAAARLEASKSFTKAFLHRHKIPTADYRVFTQLQPALDYVQSQTTPIVIKADGLAAGKGVIVAQTLAQAEQALFEMLDKHRFGEAGGSVVIEEFLHGEEVSFIAITDGTSLVPLASSQDHKRIFDGDQGANTGGMGACSPAPLVTQELQEAIMQRIMHPTIQAMAQEGTPYSGFLYAGLMITDTGPKVVEFNCRLGDPETQVILARLQSSFAQLCMNALHGQLASTPITWLSDVTVGVVLAANGYPESYQKGTALTCPETSLDSKLFHAGTCYESGQLYVSGGRVFCATGIGASFSRAKERAYQLVRKVVWEGCQYRTDIGDKAIKHEARAKAIH